MNILIGKAFHLIEMLFHNTKSMFSNLRFSNLKFSDLNFCAVSMGCNINNNLVFQ